MKILHAPLLLLASVLALTACAADVAAPAPDTVAHAARTGSPEANARAALASIDASVTPAEIGDAPIAGFQQAVMQGQVVYVSNDGKYLLQGVLVDIATRTNLNDLVMRKIRRQILASIPVKDRIVFAPVHPKYTVAVFTDVQCGYCRKLHEDIAQYNDAGIAVEYLAFPRMGLGTDDADTMVSVWCAPDRRQALTAAKHDQPIPKRACANPVATQYDDGHKAGLTGTPMILAEDGTQLGGYLSPQELLAALQARSGEHAPSTL